MGCPAVLSEVWRYTPEAAVPGRLGLGVQVRDGVGSTTQISQCTEQGYRLDEFCPASETIEACPYLK